MTEELLKMKVREVKPFPVEDYDSLKSTINRLKRNNKGEWQTSLVGFKGEKSLTIRRIK